MWKALAGWMSRSGLGDAPRTVLGELSKTLSGDVVLPTVRADGWADPTLRVRRVAVPEDHPRVLLDRPGPQLPERLGSLEETEAVLTAQMKM